MRAIPVRCDGESGALVAAPARGCDRGCGFPAYAASLRGAFALYRNAREPGQAFDVRQSAKPEIAGTNLPSRVILHICRVLHLPVRAARDQLRSRAAGEAGGQS
jgi:hypothetical protein